MDISYYLRSRTVALMTNNEWQPLCKIFCQLKKQLKYFQIESYSQNWQIADSHENVRGSKNKNIFLNRNIKVLLFRHSVVLFSKIKNKKILVFL